MHSAPAGAAKVARRMTELYVQRDQPRGVPPLSLTGERTLPDVPEENYWYRRHLVVYEWIAARAHGRRVVDLACGEGYGSAVLGSTADSVVGVDANPDAFEHAQLKYTGANVRFERNMLELWTGDVDCVVFLQTIEHVQDPDAVMAHVRELIGPAGVAYVSTPNVLTLAPKGAERSGNPWHVREYRAAEYRALCERHFASVDLLGLFHARAPARSTSGRSSTRAGTRCTGGSASRRASTTASRRRSRRATSRCDAADSIARLTSWRCCAREPPLDRPAHPHALRGGLRHVAVRRGVAVGGDRHQLPAAARRARRPPGPRDALDDAGAVRPARGARRARPLPDVPARAPARVAPARHRGRGRPGRGGGAGAERGRATPQRRMRSSAAATCWRRSRRT